MHNTESMQRYPSSHPSGVGYFKTGDDYIIIEFIDGRKYLYNYEKPGKRHVEKMKMLAIRGKDLSTYINKYVRDNYALKL